MGMASKSRRSLLQAQILLRLEQGPVRTVSELAEAVDAQRPSVSRSLKTLRIDKLVERRQNGWNLTSTGGDEAKRCNQELSRAARRIKRAIRPIAIGSELMRANKPLFESLEGESAPSFSKGIKEALALSNKAMRANRALIESLGVEIAPSFTKGMEEASTMANEAMRANKSLIGSLGVEIAPSFTKGMEEASTMADEAMKANKALIDSLGLDTVPSFTKGIVGASALGDEAMKANKALIDSLGVGIDSTFHKSFENALSKEVSQFFPSGLDNRLSQALAPLAETQHRLSGVTAQFAAMPDLGFIFSQNNTLIAKAVENVQALDSVPGTRIEGFNGALYRGVLRDVKNIGTSIRSLFSETAKIAGETRDFSGMQQTWSRMLIPSSSVANFTQSLRSGVEVKPDTTIEIVPPLPHREDTEEPLYLLLIDLNPDLADKWRGSWEALEGSNPDGLSQAAFSYRELIRMVLDELAPNVEVDRSKQSFWSKRKQQVRQVLSGSEGEFAYTMVVGLSKLYDFLSKPAHTIYRNRLVVRAALMSGDGLLLLLLSSKQVYLRPVSGPAN